MTWFWESWTQQSWIASKLPLIRIFALNGLLTGEVCAAGEAENVDDMVRTDE
jgi:hypothetical protein